MQVRLTIRLISAAALLFHFGTVLSAQQPDEYRVKAAFLYNFANFVDWPAYSFASSQEPFGICVLGQDPFGRALDDAVKGKMIDGRPITVTRNSDVQPTAGCHILFVSSSEHRRHLCKIPWQQPGVLTVGDANGFHANDVMINFTRERGRVGFEVNLANAAQGKIRLSSRLLGLAATVKR